MGQDEEKLISIIKQAKANLECEEDIKIDATTVEKIFYEKMKSQEYVVDTSNTSFVKRKDFFNGNI